LNIPRARASVSAGMFKFFAVAVGLSSLLVAGCERQPPAPPGGQPANSPSPAPTSTPSSTPAATASPLTTPTATPTPESQATPESKPTATPETAPTATPETAATPETTPSVSPEATPAVSPSTTPSPTANLDVRPTLSSQSANEYLQSYDDYITDFKSAYKAMKEGDMTKYQSVIQRARDLQTKSEKLGGELNPEEEQQFANYLNKKANELAQFASQNR
jgi:hypothetical protein